MHLFSQKVRFAMPFALAAVFSAGSMSAQQTVPAAAVHAVDVGVNYTYVHTNILPGCNCFSLNGGGAQVQVGLSRQWAAIGDFTATHRGGITQDNYSLTQLTYAFGVRYLPTHKFGPVRPFGEALAGGAHALGTLAPDNNAIGGSSNAFDFQTGGGLLLRLGKRLQLMPAQVDYVLTTFNNQNANRQNDLRFSAGIVVRVSR